MLTNTADGIVNWLKENKKGLTLKFCNRGTASGNQGWYKDMICYPIADYTGTIQLL